MKSFSGAEIKMDDQHKSLDQARAIARWENEGGKVSLLRDLAPISRDRTFTINEKRLEDTVKPKRRRGSGNPRILPMWRLA